ncbi:craniofacial development protein 2-like [Condylostylus longicornis]|uniref:craniofacial development protein 2-like n=1 Tax=Condylostylus longicornis TaxID=2530218 RepID=UPI00244DF699|nr:craniofacial development protein 2-like [Condylostylus longicornis]
MKSRTKLNKQQQQQNNKIKTKQNHTLITIIQRQQTDEKFCENLRVHMGLNDLNENEGNNTSTHRNGVGIIATDKIIDYVTECVSYSDRIMLMKINAKPVKLNIIQIYAPTADSSEDEIEELYEQINYLMKQLKPHEINMVIGDFNAKVGAGRVDGIVGPFALGLRNERGDRLIQFCQEQKLKITNTWFCLPYRRLYTWTSPQHSRGNIIRSQIDYILINKRFSSSVKSVCTYPGADVPSDHNLLVAKINIKLARTRREHRQPKIDVEKLNNTDIKNQLATEINNQLRSVMEESENIWDHKYVAKQKWMTPEILQMMEKRRTFKNKNSAEYRSIHHQIRSSIKKAKTDWLSKECSEIERLQQNHNDFNLHKKVKEVSGVYRRSHTTTLRNENGQIIIESDEIKKEWEKYIKNLFSDTSRDLHPTETFNLLSEVPITIDEIKKAIKSMKKNKTPGPDEIP